MTVVPGSAAEVLPGPSPIVGSAEAPMAVYSALGEVLNVSVSFHTRLDDARRSLAAMTGSAVQRLGARTSTMIAGVLRLRATASDARDALQTYADAIQEIHTDALRTTRKVDDELTSIRRAAAQIDEISRTIGVDSPYVWNSPPPVSMPMPRGDFHGAAAAAFVVEEVQWRGAASAWMYACESIRDSSQRWSALIADRRAAERSLVAALASTDVGRLLELGGRAAPPAALSRIMTTSLTSDRPWEPIAVQALLGGRLTPEEVAVAWAQLELDGVDTDRLIREYRFELAALDGLPFWVMDRAGRAALRYALDVRHPEQLGEAFRRMGFVEGDRSLVDFRRDLDAVQSAVVRIESRDGTGPVVQLLALGRHDGAVTAAVSVGDLDDATRVGVFVSGMMSDVRGISDALDAFETLQRGTPEMSLVTWVGYRSPNLFEETGQSRADAGAARLADFLGGISAQRRGNPIERFVSIGHSYGTNVVAEALKSTDAPVDVFVSLGSAGLRYGTAAGDLSVAEIHATHAGGDGIAGIGRHVHFRSHADDGGGVYRARVDPRKLSGAHLFSSDETPDGDAVTMHNLTSPIDWPDWMGLQWYADRLDGIAAADEVGYLNPRSSAVAGLERIMRGE